MFGKQAIDAASDLNETLSKTKVVLGDSAEEVIKWSETTAKSLGQSQQSALDAAATFAVFGKGAGLTGKELGGFSKRMTVLSSDLASFSNTSPEEAIEAISAALRGESEPIRKYGILLDDATLRAQALKLGLIATTKQALTPQQKVLAAQAEILRQSTDAQGDFARTSEGAANKQRILSAQVDNLKAKLGKGLLPIFSAGLSVITNTFLPGLEKAGNALSTMFDRVDVSALTGGFKSTISSVLPLLQKFGAQLSDLFVNHLVPLFVNFAKTILPILVDVGKSVATIFSQAIIPAFRDLVDFANANVIPIVERLASVFASFLGFLADHASTVRTFAKVALGLLVARFAALKVKAAVDGVRSFVGSLRSGVATTKAFAKSVATAGRGMLDAAKNAAKFARSALVGAANVARQTAAFVAQKVAMVAAAVAQKALTAAQWLLNAAMTANPVGLIVAGIAALVAGIVIAYKKFKPFRDIVNAVGRALRTAFEWVQKNWPKLLLILTGPFGLAIIAIKKFGPQILSGLKAAFSAVLGVAGSLLSNVGKTIIGGLLAGLRAGLTLVVAFYVQLPIKILSLLAGAATWLLGVGKRVLGGLARGIAAGAVIVFQFFTRLPGRVLGLLVTAGTWLLNVGKKILGGLFAGITAGAVGVFSFFAGLPLVIVSKVGNIARLLFDKGLNILLGLGNGIVDGAGKVLGWVAELPGRIIRAIGDVGNLLLDIGKQIIGGLIRGITGALGGLKDTLGGVGKKIIGWKGPPAKDAKLLTPVGELIIGGLINGIDNKAKDLRTTLAKVGVDLVAQTSAAAKKVRAAQERLFRFASDPGNDGLAVPKRAVAEAQKGLNASLDQLSKTPAAFQKYLSTLSQQKQQDFKNLFRIAAEQEAARKKWMAALNANKSVSDPRPQRGIGGSVAATRCPATITQNFNGPIYGDAHLRTIAKTAAIEGLREHTRKNGAVAGVRVSG